MSTIIIVLLVVVLVVAVVLKKRGDNQGNTASKKGANKTAKTAATKKVSRTTLAREEQEAAPQSTNPIPDSLRQKLEQQIQSGNYQTAEAQINQALKQDNTQHELYLFLLDIHLAQKDDFAADQLIKHVHALKLEEIAQAAEAKHREYERNRQPDSIEFSPSNFQQPHTPAATPVQNNTADFDALVQTPATQSFDDLQSEYTTPAEQEKPAEQVPEVQPLDFNFSFEQKESAEPSPVAEPVETKEQQQPLEFSFNLEPSTTSPAVEETKTVESKPELNFDLSSLEVGSNQTETKSEDIPAPSLDFNFEPSENKLETPPAAEKTEFTFDVTETVTQTEPKTAFIEPAPQAPATGNDPLAQSFPDLQQLDEAQLNLELAEQYIELGAYESARELLKNSQALLNAEQQQRSEKLLNKIAS
ncbi:FimV domain-containing protein [Acinetobacter sp. VNH17]|uniref:FimV domain-containing protein n=1 Tax=Acinetobacter thutiue TaxID=2998078 RepID=A0ABT7WQH4_9GAMM|nr:FimV domain-containing protein [Acinetobacter thutiue]MCY6412806.1 FimV domain-containing protein [Acinetobacter thutiue]MDN0014913.1 FimV domain-containing protein [Acinetobacter thutiue]